MGEVFLWEGDCNLIESFLYFRVPEVSGCGFVGPISSESYLKEEI